jgi:hypothetical protein
MSKFWKDLLTEKDGETYELQRVFFFVSTLIAVAAFVVGCIFEGWHVLKTGEFDLPNEIKQACWEGKLSGPICDAYHEAKK